MKPSLAAGVMMALAALSVVDLSNVRPCNGADFRTALCRQCRKYLKMDANLIKAYNPRSVEWVRKRDGLRHDWDTWVENLGESYHQQYLTIRSVTSRTRSRANALRVKGYFLRRMRNAVRDWRRHADKAARYRFSEEKSALITYHLQYARDRLSEAQQEIVSICCGRSDYTRRERESCALRFVPDLSVLFR